MTATLPRIGILGGTFDPPHRGHLAVGDGVRDGLGLDEIWLVPARRPYHKGAPGADYPTRLEMVRLATRGRRGFRARDLEAETEGPSYTVDLLGSLNAAGLSPDQLHFVIGADSLEDLPSWHRVQEIFTRARVVVVTRPGYDMGTTGLEPALAAQLLVIDSVAFDVSSTQLRRELGGGGAPSAVPPAVLRFVRSRGLYRRVAGARGKAGEPA